ncbi:efflux RND transporter permease subunit [Shewanella maritima]|nr:MMPL family transporter [Shewanella maritima]
MSWQQKLIRLSLASPITLGIGIFVLLLWALMGVARLNLDVNFNDYFAKDDPRFIDAKRMQHSFERNDEFLMLLESKINDEPWSSEHRQTQLMNFVAQLQRKQAIDEVGGYVEFVNQSQRQSPILSYKQHPRLPLVLSADEQAIMLTLHLNQDDQDKFGNTTLWREHHIDSVLSLSQFYWRSQGVEVHLTGAEALNWQYAKVLRHDLSWFAPGLLLVITFMALMFIKSRWWLMAIAANCLMILLLTLGIAGWFNLTLAAISAFIPVIIVTLSLAYSAHLYLGWQRIGTQVDDGTGTNAIAATFEHNRKPLFYATLTTAFGFSLLSVSPSPPIQAFGVLVACAVLIHYLLCHTLLVTVAAKAQISAVTFDRVTRFSKVATMAKRISGYPKAVMALVVLLSLVAASSAFKLKLNDDPMSYFADDNPLAISQQKVQQYFYGINLLHIQVPTSPYAIYDKAYLSFLYRFGRYLQSQDEVKRVSHIGDWVKSAGLSSSQLKRLAHENTVAELGLGAEISTGFESSLLTIYLKPLTAREMVEFEQKVELWLGENQGQLQVGKLTSSNLMFAHLCLDNAKSMLLSFAIALSLLSVILGLIKRSFAFAVAGLSLNFLPLLWMFGLWQVTGGFISIGTAVVLGIMLGIIVDDTLHLMLKLPVASDDKTEVPGLTEQFWQQYSGVIPVVSFTTMTLVLGFGIGLISEFGPIIQLSLLSVIVISFAWLFDVIVLPVVYRYLLRRPL